MSIAVNIPCWMCSYISVTLNTGRLSVLGFESVSVQNPFGLFYAVAAAGSQLMGVVYFMQALLRCTAQASEGLWLAVYTS